MPDMSGFEISRRLREIHPHSSIILVTGWQGDIESSQIKAAGINRVLFKPFKIEQLTEVIKSTVNQSSFS